MLRDFQIRREIERDGAFQTFAPRANRVLALAIITLAVNARLFGRRLCRYPETNRDRRKRNQFA